MSYNPLLFEVQSANLVLAGPASGSPAVPTFRALTLSDLPSLAFANQSLSNLTSPTAINQDLLFNPTTHNIGVQVGQTSGTDYRVNSIFVTATLAVGNLNGSSPPYALNIPAAAGTIFAGNGTSNAGGTLMGASTLFNSAQLSYIGFVKDGAFTDAPAFINNNVLSDKDVYFSLLHASSAKQDLLKFGADGTLTFLSTSNADLLWSTEGAGHIGIGHDNVASGRPKSISTTSYANFGNATQNKTGTETYYDGYIQVGSYIDGVNDIAAYMGANGSSGNQIGFNAGAGSSFSYWQYNLGGENLGWTTAVAKDVAWTTAASGFSLILRESGIIDVHTSIYVNASGSIIGTHDNSGFDLHLYAGNSTSASAGSNANVKGGDSASGLGGSVNLTAGNSTGGTGNGGAINILAGSTVGGSGGSIQIGCASLTDLPGGSLDIYAGDGKNGGNVNFSAGYGVGTNASGGNMQIFAGAATGTGNGGFISLTCAAAAGSGTGGDISLTAGNSGSGTAGNILLSTGTGGVSGHISLSTGGSERWRVDANGNLLVPSDGSVSIGSPDSGTTLERPREIYASANIYSGTKPATLASYISGFDGYIVAGNNNPGNPMTSFPVMVGSTNSYSFTYSFIGFFAPDLSYFNGFMAGTDVLGSLNNGDVVFGAFDASFSSARFNSPTSGYGFDILRGGFSVAENLYRITQGSTGTTDATPTTMQTISTVTDTTMFIRTRVVGRRIGGISGAAGDTANYQLTATVKNIAGTVTISTIQEDYVYEDQIAWNATLDVSGTNIRVRVNGDTGNNVTWTCTTETQVI